MVTNQQFCSKLFLFAGWRYVCRSVGARSTRPLPATAATCWRCPVRAAEARAVEAAAVVASLTLLQRWTPVIYRTTPKPMLKAWLKNLVTFVSTLIVFYRWQQRRSRQAVCRRRLSSWERATPGRSKWQIWSTLLAPLSSLQLPERWWKTRIFST